LLGFFQDPEDLLLGVMLFHGPGGLVFHPALSLKPLQLQGSRSSHLKQLPNSTIALEWNRVFQGQRQFNI
jgi:hypothetical protein